MITRVVDFDHGFSPLLLLLLVFITLSTFSSYAAEAFPVSQNRKHRSSRPLEMRSFDPKRLGRRIRAEAERDSMMDIPELYGPGMADNHPTSYPVPVGSSSSSPLSSSPEKSHFAGVPQRSPITPTHGSSSSSEIPSILPEIISKDGSISSFPSINEPFGSTGDNFGHGEFSGVSRAPVDNLGKAASQSMDWTLKSGLGPSIESESSHVSNGKIYDTFGSNARLVPPEMTDAEYNWHFGDGTNDHKTRHSSLVDKAWLHGDKLSGRYHRARNSALLDFDKIAENVRAGRTDPSANPINTKGDGSELPVKRKGFRYYMSDLGQFVKKHPELIPERWRSNKFLFGGMYDDYDNGKYGQSMERSKSGDPIRGMSMPPANRQPGLYRSKSLPSYMGNLEWQDDEGTGQTDPEDKYTGSQMRSGADGDSVFRGSDDFSWDRLRSRLISTAKPASPQESASKSGSGFEDWLEKNGMWGKFTVFLKRVLEEFWRGNKRHRWTDDIKQTELWQLFSRKLFKAAAKDRNL